MTLTPRPHALDDLRGMAERHGRLAAGFRLTGERNLARAHQMVADRAALALRELGMALEAVDKAQPMPTPAPRAIATICGRPAYEGRA